MDSNYHIHSAWLVEAEDAEYRKKEIIESEKVLDILKEIVYNIRRKKEKIRLEDYSQVDWSHKQAHLNGYNEALRHIESILDIHNVT